MVKTNEGNVHVMPLLALRGLTVFPQMVVHFDVGRAKSIKSLEEAMKTDQKVFLVAQRDVRTDDPEFDDLYTIGTTAIIRQMLKLPGDNIRVLVEGVSRAKIKNHISSEPHFIVEAEEVAEVTSRISAKRSQALIRRAQNLLEDYASLAPKMAYDVLMNATSAKDIGYLADYIAQSMLVKHDEKQAILEILNPVKRIESVIALLSREITILKIEQDIHSKVKGQLAKNQRDYYLREQIKVIQSELGENDDAEDEVDEYKVKIRALNLDEESKEKLLKETARLSKMHQNSPEATVIRTYLDTCIDLPWNKSTKEKLNIQSASKILDNHHYGLEKIKERILEFIAVKRMAPELKGQILCLVGPPGVGKTSIAMSLGEAIGRKVVRLSLGGVRDEADIRGHRKTYIGAMPGRIINAMRQAGVNNPIVVMDEIDKLGNDFRGDPSAALLEVLDVEQNYAFRDHYIELPFDLSNVLFVTTANTTDTIPRPLLDRMEVLELSSYTDEEKLQIAKRHLISKQLLRHGLKKTQVRFTDDSIREIIAGYTRESGVRKLESQIAAVCRKCARKIVESDVKRISITADNLEDFLGVRRYKPEKRRGIDEVGVATGLAWTSVGGEILEVEVGVVPGDGKIELTGNLGSVMKESARAALTYIRSRQASLGIDKDFHKKYDIHIHFPEGAVPKDGPSAGITMAVAMISALTGHPVYKDVAMTGEISLRGRVLPIGGLKEKTMAAFRNGIKTIILPLENEKDLEEIDPTVHSALNFILADHMDAVISAAINIPKKQQTKTKPPEGQDITFEDMPNLPAEPERNIGGYRLDKN